jgi:large subunit ribosomal protein L29
MAKAKDLREMSSEELLAQDAELRKEIYEVRNALSSKKEDAKPHQIQVKRKEIARILTILREREITV